MSAQPDQVFRSALDALNRADVAALETLFHRHGEAVIVGPGKEPERAYGAGALLRFAAELPVPGGAALIEPSSIAVVGGWLMAEVLVETLGPGDAVRQGWLCGIDGGRIVTLRAYADPETASDAARRRPRADIARLFEHARDAVLLLDDDTGVIGANDAARRLFGIGAEELRSASLANLVAERGVRSWRHAWALLRARGEVNVATVVRDARGTEHPVLVSGQAGARLPHYLVVMRESTAPPETAGTPRLTAREQEIFQLLADGHNAPAIAKKLVLSPATVRSHVQNGVARLGARTRVQAIALAVARGYVQL